MSNNTKQLMSIVIPCYNEEDAIPFFVSEITNVMSGIEGVNYELIFVDDGSRDATLSVIRKLSESNDHVRYISFSRNFGKEAAMIAGLKAAMGEIVAIMDADMQDPPGLLPEMYEAITVEGFECVATRRVTRKGEPAIRSFFARGFYRLINKISHTEIVDGARDFRLMRCNVVDAVLMLGEKSRFSKGLFSWVGFKTKYLEYENIERKHGKSKWSFWKLLIYSIDGIVSFSTAPLIWVSLAGIAFCIFAFLMIIYFVLMKLIAGIDIDGYAAMITIILFLGGVQLLSIGVLGQYFAKMFIEVKDRPLYIIRESSDD